jgi:predicted metal-dependent HD superfamily phosphohydrolase
MNMNELSQMHTELGNRFYVHLSAINSDVTPENAQALWQDIAVRYNEEQRAYHTLHHIQQLFGQFEQIKPHLNDPDIIALAMYYHDVIYEPTRSDNELKSAEFAVEVLGHYLDADQCQHIYALIMMTASHEIDKIDEWSDIAKEKNSYSDAAYLLDMDLSILGASWSAYEKYAKAVRQEYLHVPIADYCAGRTEVLKGLLAHPKLYLTDYYYEQLEFQARDNIKREVNSLLHAQLNE